MIRLVSQEINEIISSTCKSEVCKKQYFKKSTEIKQSPFCHSDRKFSLNSKTLYCGFTGVGSKIKSYLNGLIALWPWANSLSFLSVSIGIIISTLGLL